MERGDLKQGASSEQGPLNKAFPGTWPSQTFPYSALQHRAVVFLWKTGIPAPSQAALMLLLPWGIPSPSHAKFPPWLGLWVLGGQAREGQASWFCPLQGLVELNTEVGMGVRIGGS